MTFLVCADFIRNAELLDDQRLAKQRVEGHQILKAIVENSGWKHHPIVKAWRHYLGALKYYINCIILEFIRRGGNNNLPLLDVPHTILMPWWVSWERLHHSHRAMLLRKNPFYYEGKFTVNPEYMLYGYIWPHSVTYDNRNANLSTITAPIPDELVDPVYCSSTVKSGPRTGQQCHRLVKDKQPQCSIHRK